VRPYCWASDRLELALAARRAIAVEAMNEFGAGAAAATEAAEKALAAGAALARAYHAQARYEVGLRSLPGVGWWLSSMEPCYDCKMTLSLPGVRWLHGHTGCHQVNRVLTAK
jgi:hypothetical protein